nr:HTTM domain-containing protein [Pseudenhygromyxa sp. WMMC2535]
MRAPEDGSALALFRVSFGLAVAWDAARYMWKGWAWTHYCEPAFLFHYEGFAWLEPLSASGMAAVYAGMVVAGLMIAAGAFYRVAVVYYFLAHTYAFLLSPAHYLNHAYLISLLAFLLMWMPAHRVLSVDAWRDARLGDRPTPRWPRFVLQAQLTIVYVFGGIAKLNSDWLHGVPVAQWMQNAAERNPWAAGLIAAPVFVPFVQWAGIAFDLLIVPALVWRKTRPLAVAAALVFHVSNAALFEIGVFPWLMLGATPIFFAADWPRHVPVLGARLGAREPAAVGPASMSRVLVAGIGLWLAIQCALPLRHLLYPGPVAWTEEGHKYAWRMKLRSKKGKLRFRVRDPETGEVWKVRGKGELTKRQRRKMAGQPELILQYAHHIAARERARLGHPVEVRVDAWARLNYRDYQRLIDPDVDLAAVEASLGHAEWIAPFEWTPPPRPSR